MRKTLQEILDQPAAWSRTIAAFLDNRDQLVDYFEKYKKADVVLAGCGTSYYLPLTAAALYSKFTARKSIGVPASEIMLFPEALFSPGADYLLIAISRTGKTPETLAALRYAKEVLNAGTMLISCTDGSEMTKYSELSLICPRVAEETKYMTRSFTSMLLGWQLVTAFVSKNKSLEEELLLLPQRGERILSQYQHVMEKLARSREFRLYVFLGHGSLYGIAAESMLKLKEMACVPAEVYHGMELMHGPKYAVDNDSLIVYLLSDSAQKEEIALLKRIKDWGGNIKVICDKSAAGVSYIANDVYELNSGLTENARHILIMLVTQLYAYYRALSAGKDIE